MSDFQFPFIPAWLDDIGLSKSEFRVYCRICRRAGKSGWCYEGSKAIAQTCEMNVNTVRKSIKDLEQKGLILVDRAKGCKSKIKPLIPSKGELKKDQGELKEDHLPNQNEITYRTKMRSTLHQNEIHPALKEDHHKVIPLRESLEVTPVKVKEGEKPKEKPKGKVLDPYLANRTQPRQTNDPDKTEAAIAAIEILGDQWENFILSVAKKSLEWGVSDYGYTDNLELRKKLIKRKWLQNKYKAGEMFDLIDQYLDEQKAKRERLQPREAPLNPFFVQVGKLYKKNPPEAKKLAGNQWNKFYKEINRYVGQL